MEDNALGMLHRVAGGDVVPPRRSGALTQPLQKILAADPADRPTMPQVRDELATLAAGRGGDTTTILLARTDVGSTAPGRNRTTNFPAGAAAAAATAAPPVPPSPAAAAQPSAAAPPPPPWDRPEREQAPREPGRRGGRALWVAAALVALVLAGLIAVWAFDPFADNSSDAQGSSAARTSSAATQPTTEPTQPSTSSSAASSAATSAAPPTNAASVRRQDVDKAVKDFFSNIPKNLQAAYQLTSPRFQGQHSYDNFAGFWNEFQDVKISNIQSADGSTEPTLDIEYVFKDGRRQTEHHQLTFVVGDSGQLQLDSDNQAG
jgi:hypothetical protein